MTPADTFWAVFAAVLGANLLTGAFLWEMMTYGRLEKSGGTKSDQAVTALALILFTFAALGLAGFITLAPTQ